MHNYIDPKIDNQAVLGLSGTAGSLAYKVHEVVEHIHSAELIFGNNSTSMGQDTPIPFVVEGGDNAWGTEVLISGTTNIDGGGSVRKCTIDQLYVTAVDDADEVSIFEILYSTAGAEVTSVVTDDSSDNFTKSGHGLINGDRIIITNLATTTGLDAITVYYVINMSGDTFQVSLTLAGSAVVLGTGDGTCSFRKLTSTSLTKKVVCMNGTTTNAFPIQLTGVKIPCTSYISVRAKSETGTTVAISFLLGLHIYIA